MRSAHIKRAHSGRPSCSLTHVGLTQTAYLPRSHVFLATKIYAAATKGPGKFTAAPVAQVSKTVAALLRDSTGMGDEAPSTCPAGARPRNTPKETLGAEQTTNWRQRLGRAAGVVANAGDGFVQTLRKLLYCQERFHERTSPVPTDRRSAKSDEVR